ncbi:50S ribosomal protein L2, partial [Candidatus Bathyarchaeota archaeon]|nr:50S ribosomal protein L2 [Candidatus Bathyarchaeota archaeon]
MGKRLRVQRRGRGGSTFRASTHKRIAPSCYAFLQNLNETTLVRATVKNILHEPGRGTPLTENRLDSGKTFHVIATEGIAVGQEIQIGESAPPEIGNVLPLGKMPAGILISNIELLPGDGGKFARASGTYASVVSHTPEGTLVKLPSGKSLYVSDLCLATVGIVSGAGRTDRPFLKAGKKQAWMNAKGRVYPITKGIAMNPVSHPHGG